MNFMTKWFWVSCARDVVNGSLSPLKRMLVVVLLHDRINHCKDSWLKRSIHSQGRIKDLAKGEYCGRCGSLVSFDDLCLCASRGCVIKSMQDSCIQWKN